MPTPALLERFRVKVAKLRESLDDEAVRPEAAGIIARLIESVTIHPGSAEGEVIANASDLLAFATNDNAAREGGVSSSITVVAGTGFEPVTFRL